MTRRARGFGIHPSIHPSIRPSFTSRRARGTTDRSTDRSIDESPFVTRDRATEARPTTVAATMASEVDAAARALEETTIAEECIQPNELRMLLEKKPTPVCYDGFEPSGRMHICLLYTSPSPRDATLSRMPSSA